MSSPTTPTARFEALRAAGTDSAQQNAIAALHRVAGRSYESTAEFWQRWSTQCGCLEAILRSGAELVLWMQQQLLCAIWQERALPGGGLRQRDRGTTPISVELALRRLDAFHQATAAFDACMDRYEGMAFDVENMHGDERSIAKSRKTIGDMRRIVARIESEHDDDLKRAQHAAQVDAENKRQRELVRWVHPEHARLSGKPTTASIRGWQECVVKDRIVWTNGAILDLAGEPYLSGWRTFLEPLPRQSPLDGSYCVLNGGPRLKAVAVYRSANGKRNGDVAILADTSNELVFVNATFVRYFNARYPKAVWHKQADGNCRVEVNCDPVGIVGSLTHLTDATGPILRLEDVLGRLQQADTLRSAAA